MYAPSKSGAPLKSPLIIEFWSAAQKPAHLRLREWRFSSAPANLNGAPSGPIQWSDYYMPVLLLKLYKHSWMAQVDLAQCLPFNVHFHYRPSCWVPHIWINIHSESDLLDLLISFTSGCLWSSKNKSWFDALVKHFDSKNQDFFIPFP